MPSANKGATPVGLVGESSSEEPPSKTARLDRSAAAPATTNDAENDSASSQQLASQKISKLLEWIHRLEEEEQDESTTTKATTADNGLSSTIRIASSQHVGLGAFAAKEIPPGGLIGRIPNTAIMTVEKSATQSIVGKAIADMKFRDASSCNQRPTKEFILWLDMCHGRLDENHPHHSYLASLPSKAPDVPSWSDEEALKALEGTNLGAAAARAAQERRQEYETWMPQIQQQCPQIFGSNEDGFQFQDFRWASGMYFSRRFPPKLLLDASGNNNTAHREDLSNSIDPKTTSAEKRHTVGILLPGLDLANHRPHQPITWSGSATHVTFTNSSTEAIPKDAELFNNYGPKGNDMLMMMYGFALLDNVHDCYGLHLILTMMQQQQGHGDEDEVHAVKKDLGVFQIHRDDSPMDEQFPPGLWRALNQMFVDDAGVDGVVGEDNNEDNAPIEIGLEAIEFLLETLQRRLQPFLVSKEKDSTCQTDVDRYRHGQRVVLEQAIETLEQMIPPEDDEEEQEEEAVGF